MSMISGVLFICFHIAQSIETDIKTARGYGFYLRVFNSISHSFAAHTREMTS